MCRQALYVQKCGCGTPNGGLGLGLVLLLLFVGVGMLCVQVWVTTKRGLGFISAQAGRNHHLDAAAEHCGNTQVMLYEQSGGAQEISVWIGRLLPPPADQ